MDLDDAQNLAGQTALVNRLDLMNQRAQLVDGWRQIAVFANSLLGTFDVRYHMDVLTPPPDVAQPVNFEGQRARHQLTFNTELPLVRRLERNNYRASLISYQRARRSLMLAEDSVLFQVRQNVRALRQLAQDYRIQQRALELAYLQVENSLETFRAPADPGSARDAASAAASLTNQLIQAQQSVPNSQNRVFSSWINYVTTRMALYRDLELLQVDSRGVWIDEFASPDCTAPEGCDQSPAGPEPQ
jgi:outer membrane protein TolC